MPDEYAIGIDFGTTKSLLAYISRLTDKSIPPQFAVFEGIAPPLTPSSTDYPYFRNGSSTVVQPVPTAVAIKRSTIQNTSIEMLAGFAAIDYKNHNLNEYRVVTDLKEKISALREGRYIAIQRERFAVEGLVAYFLWTLRAHANDLDQVPIDQRGITITVPAKSSIIQRMSMQLAATIAGFKGQIDIVEEPVAAFLYHRHISFDRFQTPRNSYKYALVIDFGGGTCDLAVIQFLDKKLPRVCGRAMGRFGGAKIDQRLLEAFWLDPQRTEHLPIDSADFVEMTTAQQNLLLAHARQTKELLSGGMNSHSQDITGAIPGVTSPIFAPRITQDMLKNTLENDPFDAEYADSPQPNQPLSLKEHIRELVKRTLNDAQIHRDAISKLIFAGGSTQLPGVKDWVVEYLRCDDEAGRANVSLQDSDIRDQHPDVCVAGGAAIHQLYRHHKMKKWRGAITATLHSRIWIMHYKGKSETDIGKVILGEPNDKLPIKRLGYWDAKLIYPARSWDDGEMRLVIVEGSDDFGRSPNWSETILLKKSFGRSLSLASYLKAILIRYIIDEYGVLQRISWTPGSFFTGWQSRNKGEKFNIIGKEEVIDIDVNELRTDNIKRIFDLRKRFIPKYPAR